MPLDKSHIGGQRIMVGSRNRTVNKRFDAANPTTRKNPINDPSVLQK